MSVSAADRCSIYCITVLPNLSDSVVCIPFIHVGRVQRKHTVGMEIFRGEMQNQNNNTFIILTTINIYTLIPTTKLVENAFNK